VSENFEWSIAMSIKLNLTSSEIQTANILTAHTELPFILPPPNILPPPKFYAWVLINAKYDQLGGAAGFLGQAVTGQLGTIASSPNGLGYFIHYQGGSIYWSPQTGAHEVHGAIRDKWASLGWEQSLLGYPDTDETGTPDGVGRYNHFQGGSIYWTPSTGAHEVHGAIRDEWASLGWERSFLGYPVTDETGTPDGIGRYNYFQGGSIYWTPWTGAQTADKCDPIRSELQDLEVRLEGITKYEQPGKPGDHPQITAEWAEVHNLVEKTRFKLRACEPKLPPPPPPPPVPLTLTLTNFVCLDQSDDIRVFGFNVEDDEPYALVFAVDLKIVASIPVGATNSKMTLVGPLLDVDPGDRSAPANVIWGLSNAPDMVTSANNLIVLVAMMENDSGSPDQARTVLETAAKAGLVANLPAFTSQQIPRQELVSRIIAAMAGSMGAAKVGIPNPDDNIGDIQELRFFQYELDDIYKNQGPNEKSLTFEGDDAKYVLKFRMFR
jgi:hypothetical protein